MLGHNGKVAVVTGAGRGIGRAFAERLARDGVDVVPVDLEAPEQTAAAVRSKGRRSLAVACDVSSEEAIAGVYRAVKTELGRCDILVNNAGVFPVASFEDLTFEDWRHVLSVNLDALFLTSKAFVPDMRRRRWGRIVNLASALDTTHVLPYIASKAGLAGFTRALANEVGEYGITVNAISPSLVRTPGTMNRAIGPGNVPNSELWEFCSRAQSIKRTQEPEDLVGTLSFLTSDEASFVTGHVLYADGGMIRAVP